MEKDTLALVNEENNKSSVNIQASLDFTIINTKLKMAFSKIGDEQVFVIMPTEAEPSKGMTIKEMIDDINGMIGGYGGEATDLDKGSIEKTITDVDQATRKDADKYTAFDVKTIRVVLRQAFILLRKGKKTEYALQIEVYADKLFPKGTTFINVEKLSLAMWNTERERFLNMMDIINIEQLLKS